MQCSFQNEEVRLDGSYISSICINEAKIMITGDPCYGLCYGCAYKQLETENEKLKESNFELTDENCNLHVELGELKREVVFLPIAYLHALDTIADSVTDKKLLYFIQESKKNLKGE